MSLTARYTKAMIAGRVDECIQIEQAHGLYGYPPVIVSVGLAAVDDGEDPVAAVDAFIAGEGT